MERLEELFSSCLRVYVKGCEKREFIKSICPDYCQVIDLEELGCLSLESLNVLYKNEAIRCKHHKLLKHKCALTNAINLRKWFSSWDK